MLIGIVVEGVTGVVVGVVDMMMLLHPEWRGWKECNYWRGMHAMLVM